MQPFPCCLSRLTSPFVGPKYLFKLGIRRGYWWAHVSLLRPLQWNKSRSHGDVIRSVLISLMCERHKLGLQLPSCVFHTWGDNCCHCLEESAAYVVYRQGGARQFGQPDTYKLIFGQKTKRGRFCPQMHIFVELLGVRKHQKVESVEKSKEQRQ